MINTEDIPPERAADDTRSGAGESTGGIGKTIQAAVPSTRRFVRRHPYAGLLGAALAGVWLVRGKPLRTLGRSLMLGLAARRFLALLPSDVLGRQSSAPPSRRAPRRPL